MMAIQNSDKVEEQEWLMKRKCKHNQDQWSTNQNKSIPSKLLLSSVLEEVEFKGHKQQIVICNLQDQDITHLDLLFHNKVNQVV